MADTIYRHEAIEAIEHITSSMSVCINTDECHGMKRMQRQAVIELANLPPAQPEIIHCKDCIWYELPSHKITENCVLWMKSNGILLPIKPDDFCSRAERRTDEETNIS